MRTINTEKMKNKSCVSLWLANVCDKETLEKVTTDSYSDDGDMIPSEFSVLFKTDNHDSDFAEIEFVGESESISKMLDGFSYDDEIIPVFEQMGIDTRGFNSVILLYRMKYSGEKKDGAISDCTFKFIGSVEYECTEQKQQRFAIVELPKYKNEQKYQHIGGGIFEDLENKRYVITLRINLEDGEDSQYPLEDILDEYLVNCTDHFEEGENEDGTLWVEAEIEDGNDENFESLDTIKKIAALAENRVLVKQEVPEKATDEIPLDPKVTELNQALINAEYNVNITPSQIGTFLTITSQIGLFAFTGIGEPDWVITMSNAYKVAADSYKTEIIVRDNCFWFGSPEVVEIIESVLVHGICPLPKSKDYTKL